MAHIRLRSIHAQIKGANARQEQALDTYEQTVLTAFQDVEDGLVAYANEQTRYHALNDSASPIAAQWESPPNFTAPATAIS